MNGWVSMIMLFYEFDTGCTIITVYKVIEM